ncbi:MAG TPA: bifunctional UDP-N-acetylglucosamine diphosphorylase/glucosamine-1-phosphate N-acetyltransferase GlmU [Stellaceae bacterium]|jgi:bifunctional UDP-N-acetylglucosamine pyrophosphorylase/glucosamine-1-phosphate N-acetyltransferase|nr:bifunctional UDP-N-acetylglucosamine diphosphorylase/glucosamine-1-phosphate N-acetyltransferase GlmU [Stellaceae bacterium]
MTNSLAILILAAGQGTRMKSARPKVLHEIANRPMICHALAAAQALQPQHIIAVIGPGMEAVAKAIAPTPTVIQPLQRGTGDAVAAARDALKDFAGDVLVLYGDTPLIRPATLAALLSERRRQSAAVAVIGMRPAEPGEYGRLVLDYDGALKAIVEAKDASEEQRLIALCNSGVMAIDGARLWTLIDALGNTNAKHEYYLTDIVGIARARGLRCAALEAPAEEVMGVNSRAELAAAEAVMQRRLRAAAMAEGVTFTAPETVFMSADTKLGRDCTVGPFVVFGPAVTVGESVEIPAFCHVSGATVGDRAILGPFARLRPGAELADGVHIGNFVEVKNSKLGRGVKANHLAYLGDASIGAGTNIGAGTITCNYDGVDKHRTEIGKDVFIGTNSSLVAPVTIGDGAMIAAGSVITDNVPADALALGRGRQVVKAGRAAAWKAAKRGAAKPAKSAKPAKKKR